MAMTARPQALIVGCGYVGQRLAQRLASTYDITVIVRTAASASALERQGLRVLTLDLDRVRSPGRIPETLMEVMFYLAPPQNSGESDLRLNRFLQLSTVPPRTFVYMSTTGVYGDTKGALVDESTRVDPQTDRARRRVSAEEMTRVWCTESRVRRVVLRVAGIYGPERLPIERLRNGEPTLRPEDAGISNRIHVEDLVEVCATVARDPEARGVYNVTDGNSMTSTEFLDRLAAIAGLPQAPRVSMDEAQLTFSIERLSFINESRRVSNDRMLRHLGIELRYADVDAGIRASLDPSGCAGG
jgi:nucleoside-diphosphate-sugar epimerase